MTQTRTILAAAFCLSVLLPCAAYASDPDEELENDPSIQEEREADAGRTRDELDRLPRPVPDWNVGGADPDADLKAMGADKYYFASRGSFGVSVTILTDRPIEDFAPKSWRVLGRYGAPATGDGEPWMSFVHLLDGRYVLAITGRTMRNGGTFCGSLNGEQRLFERPDVKRAREEPRPELARQMFASAVRTMADEPISCSRYYGDRERGYTYRAFTLDGRDLKESLPASEPPSGNPTHRIIVPACPIDRIMKRPINFIEETRRSPGYEFPIWSTLPRPRSC